MIPSSLAEPWMRGVAANPAATAGVLLRLLDPAGSAAWTVLCEERDLPDAVIEAVIRHRERAVRLAFARNPFADPAQRGRLIDDPDDRVRAILAGGPRNRPGCPRPLPDDVVEKFLLADNDGSHQLLTNAEIGQELIFSRQIRRGLHQDRVQHPDPRLRVWAAGHWLYLSPQQRDALLTDPDPMVRERAQRESRTQDPEAMAADLPEQDCHHRSMLLINYAVSRKVAEVCLATGRNLWALAHNPHTPADIVARLARDADPKVRERIASRSDLDPALLSELAHDPEPIVRTRALVHTLPRTEPQRAAIDRIIGHTANDIGQVEQPLGDPEADWYESCALSAHPLLRQVAATYSELPAEAMRNLAEDSDPEVRHLLAFNHPHASANLLLDAFIACPRQRLFLLTLPHMPRTGLSRLVAHDDPGVRALAAADPTLGELLKALLADPDLSVQRAAAANPAVTPAQLMALLDDPNLAEAAATNPGLPSEKLHTLLDRAGIPPFQAGTARMSDDHTG
jgi:hypothetical protein